MTTKIEKTELDLGLESVPLKAKSKSKRTRRITRPKRSASIMVRVFPEEKERIEQLSKEHLLTPSEFIRSSALGNLTQSNIEALIEQRALEKLETVKEQYFNIRIDEELKDKFDNLCDELGLTITGAFNIFVKTMIREKRIPFEVGIPNATTNKAMREVDKMINQPNKHKGFSNVDKMMEDILK